MANKRGKASKNKKQSDGTDTLPNNMTSDATDSTSGGATSSNDPPTNQNDPPTKLGSSKTPPTSEPTTTPFGEEEVNLDDLSADQLELSAEELYELFIAACEFAHQCRRKVKEVMEGITAPVPR